MIFQLIAIFISLILFVTAPQAYSSAYCYMSFVIFLYSTYKILKFDFKNINTINFNLFYLFSFLFCTYIFPVVLMPMGETGYLYSTSVLGVNESSVNVCTCLASFAISVYAFSYCTNIRRVEIRNQQSMKLSSSLDFILALVTLALSVSSILFINANSDSVAMTESPYLFVVFYSLLAICLVNICKKKPDSHPIYFFIKNAKVLISCSCLIVLIMLYMGDRGPILSIGMIFLGSVSIYLKNIKVKYLVPLFIAGVVGMFLIGVLRSGDGSFRTGGVSGFSSSAKEVLSTGNGTVWEVFSDFTDRYIELYSGYEYHEKNGNYYPLKILPIIASPVPLLPNILSDVIYNKPFLELSSVKAINSSIFRSRDGWFGTHQVIDIYMSWGIVGVFIIFYLQGVIFAKISSRHKSSLLYGILYIVLLSKSLYLPRAVFFDLYRPIVWTYLLYIVFAKKNRV